MPYIKDNCMSCGQCIEVCKAGAIDTRTDSAGYGKAYIIQRLCKDCGACLKFDCPAEAIKSE